MNRVDVQNRLVECGLTSGEVTTELALYDGLSPANQALYQDWMEQLSNADIVIQVRSGNPARTPPIYTHDQDNNPVDPSVATIHGKAFLISYDAATRPSGVAVVLWQTEAQPASPQTDDLWLKPSTGTIKRWTGTVWNIISQIVSGAIDFVTNTDATTRPAGTSVVMWVTTGAPSATPVTNDLWLSPTTNSFQRWTGTAWQPVNNATYVAITESPLNPDTAFGAAGNGTTDDNAAWTAGLAALTQPTKIQLPPNRSYRLAAGNIPCPVPVTIIGAGSGTIGGGARPGIAGARSIITCETPNVPALQLNADGSHATDVLFRYTGGSTPVAGSTGLYLAQSIHSRAERCIFADFYDGAWMEDGGERWFIDNIVVGAYRYGLYYRDTPLPDGGDDKVRGNQFIATRNATAAIFSSSGGGALMQGNKVNARGGSYVNGVKIVYPTGATTGFVLQLLGDSIENVSGDAVYVEAQGTAALAIVQIDGLEVGLYGNTTGSAVKLVGGASGAIIDALIDNLIVRQSGGPSSAYAVDLTNVTGGSIGKIALDGEMAGRIKRTTCSNIRVAPPLPNMVTGGYVTGPEADAVGSNAGDYSTSNTAGWDTLDAANLTATVYADVGDRLELDFDGSFYHQTANATGDLQFAVAGTRVGPAKRKKFVNTLAADPVRIGYSHTVASGDRSGGKVSVTVQWTTSSAASGPFSMGNASGLYPSLRVKNLGQPY